MSATIISGIEARDAHFKTLKERLGTLMHVPTMTIIQIGQRPDSTSFIRGKKRFGDKLGVITNHIEVDESISQPELIELIEKCDKDKNIHGIIVQLPLPLHLDRDTIINTISPHKDVDALTATNVARWLEGVEDAILPATARGVRELLAHYNISLFNAHVVILGRSDLVGKPLAAMCVNEGANVMVCHSKTPDLISETMRADILISAVGKPNLIQAKHVKKGAVVIDVGINTVKGEKLEDEVEGTKLVGDVDFDAVKEIASAISPVPGGVGPMTVLALFENLVDLCKM